MVFVTKTVGCPKLELLTQIAWTNVQGAQKLEILNTVSAKWRNIGILLGQKIADLDRYQKITKPGAASMFLTIGSTE